MVPRLSALKRSSGAVKSETIMLSKSFVLAGAVLAGAAFAPGLSQAATALGSATAPATADGTSLVQKVHIPGRCIAWRHECAERWGWGTWRWHRCLARHGCG
jgi:hypothetical protein